MAPRHAEIAGAGFAGLTLGALLAERGWSVRIHERADQVREIGAGIFIHNNGLYVLESLGLMSRLATRGVELECSRMVDQRGLPLQERTHQGTSPLWSFPRQALVEELHRAAVERGVVIQSGEPVAGLDPSGILALEDGRRYTADLVIGADGHRSRARESLGLTAAQRYLTTRSTRYLLAGRAFAEAPATTEHWSGRRRIALAACGPSNTYVYMACPKGDGRGGRQPLDVASWTSSFPRLADVFGTLAVQQSVQTLYSYVRCRAWSRGRAVLIGDAAHAMAPTLGQAANLAMSNAWCLAVALDWTLDILSALQMWEQRVRWVTEATQRWAGLYDLATKYWPGPLVAVRARVIWAFGASDYLNAHLRVAASHPPNTLMPLPTSSDHHMN
jgi:2-polyprenyl-6-methoxyphenol hydroxylase-like FAD-dependent oxidoreductase